MNPTFLNRFEKVVDEVPVDVPTAFVGVDNLDGLTIGEPIEREVEARLSPDELVLVARAPEAKRLAAEIATSREFRRMRERLGPRAAITVIGFDARGVESERIEVVPGDVRSGISLDELVRRGITAIFRERGGFVESTASYHFRNPSGRHTSRFIRLSNLLVYHCEISFIALALLGSIPCDARLVYVDTPSLFAVVAALNEHRMALDRKLPILVADSFRSYEEVDTYEFTDVATATAIISASSSGTLAKRVEARGLHASRIVHALYLGKVVPGVNFAVDLGSDPDSNPGGLQTERTTFDDAGVCELCQEGSTPIPLRGDQFDIAPPQPKALTVKVTHAPKGLAQTMARLVGSGCFQVFASSDRQLGVDAAALLATKAFDDRLAYFVHRDIPPVRHILLADAEARPLAERVAAIAGVTAAYHDREATDALEAALKADPRGALLVVSTIIGSGRVLLDISRDLRPFCSDRPIIYLVGLARTESQAAVEILRRDIEMTKCPVPHPLAIVERIELPGTDFANSWARELTFLNLQGGTSLSAALAARRDRLGESSRPMIDDLFMANDHGLRLELRPGFAFWPEALARRPHAQSDVFVTVAAVLQQLRNVDRGEGDALVTNWFQQTLLSPGNFGRYNDGIIQASLLRAARPTELDFADDASLSRDAGRIIRRIVGDPMRARGEAAAEFLIAIGSGRLKLDRADLDVVLQTVPGAPPIVEELRQLAVKATAPAV
jgi:hypothetical protein